MNRQLLKSLTIAAILLSSGSTFADVRAYLNQNAFYEGDPITLTIESSTNNNAQPDLSPLGTNFEVLGTSTNTEINVLNGKRSFKKSWHIELQAKIKGKLQIPSLTIGNEVTQAIELNITDLPAEIKAETDKHISIEASIGKNTGKTYVQQQIPYTVKFFYDASMQRGEISSLNIENAVTEQLGRDRRYKIIRNGKKINVVEKNYVISPEKSGTLHIPPVTVKGRIALSGGNSKQLQQRMDQTDILNRFFNDFRNDPFFNDPFDGGLFSKRNHGPSKPFTASSKSIDIEILPVPSAFTGASWLPAESISIEDSWSKQPPNLKVGEPVTRTIILQAKGLAGSQIPALVIPQAKNLKTYPEPAKSETRTDGKTVYGIQQLEITYIPSKKGDVIIPPINIDWWNVKTEKQESFTLPEWHLNVEQGAQNSQLEFDVVEPAVETPKKEENETTTPDNTAELSEDNTLNTPIWKWALLLGFLLVSALLFLFFIKKNKKKSQSSQTPQKLIGNINEIRASLLNACKQNNKQQAAKELIHYAQLHWKDDSIQNLGAIASQLPSGKSVINDLDKSLYASKSSDWKGDKLSQLITNGLNRVEKQTIINKDSGLAPLYPN